MAQVELGSTTGGHGGGSEYRAYDNRGRRRARTLVGRPTFRTVAQPERNQLIKGFSTGTSTKHENDVNGLVAQYFWGTRKTPLVLMETAPGTVAGVCGFSPEALSFSIAVHLPQPEHVEVPVVKVPNASYIAVIGLSADFRGYKLEDGTRLGVYLLGGALSQIRILGGEGRTPAVWAYVHPDNEKSHEMFSAHGFGRIPPRKPGADEKRYRSREP